MESWSTVDRINLCLIFGAEAESRTRMGLPPTVFETAASTIPPLRLVRDMERKRGFEPPTLTLAR